MPLPRFLSPRLLSSWTPGPSTLGGGSAGSNKLPLSVPVQQQANWCWAAVSTGVSRYFTSTSAWQQCTVANAALPRTDCCAGGASDPERCDKPWYLESALTATSNFDRMEMRPFTFAEVQTEIGRGHPLCSRIGWIGGGGHFVAIVGWRVGVSGMKYVDVSDPIHLGAQIEFSRFVSTYRSAGAWTHSYVTTRPAVAMAAAGGASGPFVPQDPTAIGA